MVFQEGAGETWDHSLLKILSMYSFIHPFILSFHKYSYLLNALCVVRSREFVLNAVAITFRIHTPKTWKGS